MSSRSSGPMVVTGRLTCDAESLHHHDRAGASGEGDRSTMPLRCLDPSGRSIHAFDLSDDEWKALETENRKTRHLRMPCCSSHVTLKRSRLGTPFFAHKAVGSCTTAPETEEHLHLKQMVV